MLHQRVEEGVARRVAGLPGGAEGSGQRREGDEPGQAEVAGGGVEVERRVGLGLQRAVELVRGDRRQDAVVERSGGMHHTADADAVAGQSGEGGVQRGPVRGVAGDAADRGAEPAQPLDGQRPGAVRRREAPAQQHHLPHPVLGHQVLGDEPSQPAVAAGDQDRATGVPGGVRGREGEHDLADVPGLAEVAEGTRGPPHVPGGDPRQLERSLVEQGEQGGEHLLNPVRTGVPHVVRVVRHAGVRDPDHVLVTPLGLAHLQEPAAARQQPQRGVDVLPRQGVEYHVDAPAAAGRGEAAFEVERPGRPDAVVGHSGGAQRVPLARARRGEDLGPQVAGQLDRGRADAAGPGVDQDRLPGAEAGEVHQAVVRGQIGHRDGGRLLERPAGRDAAQQPVVCHRDRADAREHAHHPVAGPQRGDPGARLQDDARALASLAGATGVRVDRRRDHLQGEQDVAEVETGRVHPHPHLPGRQRRARLRPG